jgi:hypothetical protein
VGGEKEHQSEEKFEPSHGLSVAEARGGGKPFA